MKKTFIIFLLVGAMCLSGCSSSHEFDTEVSAVYVTADGVVTSADIEDFSGDNYSESELTAYVEGAVAAFNYESAGISEAYELSDTVLPVYIDQLEVADNVASLYLVYSSCDYYLEFNGKAYGLSYLELTSITQIQEEYSGTSSDENEGFLSAEFVDTDGASVDADTVISKKKLNVLITEGAATIQVDGKIKYVSSNVTVADDYTVETPEDGLCYIVFK